LQISKATQPLAGKECENIKRAKQRTRGHGASRVACRENRNVMLQLSPFESVNRT